jgi:hypothetical protein
MDTNSRGRRKDDAMIYGYELKIFKVTYTESSYEEIEAAESMVIAEDIQAAIIKWNWRFVTKPKARMIGIKLYWEYPII